MSALLWTGVVTTSITCYMETTAMKTLSAAETTLIYQTEPLWGALVAACIFGERFGLSAVIGGGLIIGGCSMSNFGLKQLGLGFDINDNNSDEDTNESELRELAIVPTTPSPEPFC